MDGRVLIVPDEHAERIAELSERNMQTKSVGTHFLLWRAIQEIFPEVRADELWSLSSRSVDGRIVLAVVEQLPDQKPKPWWRIW